MSGEPREELNKRMNGAGLDQVKSSLTYFQSLDTTPR